MDRQIMTKKQGARVMDYKAKSRRLLNRYYAIADRLTKDAKKLLDSGADIRACEEHPALSTILHSAESAIGEIVRLTPMCEDQQVPANNSIFTFRDPDWEHLAQNAERLRASMDASKDEAPN